MSVVSELHLPFPCSHLTQMDLFLFILFIYGMQVTFPVADHLMSQPLTEAAASGHSVIWLHDLLQSSGIITFWQPDPCQT